MSTNQCQNSSRKLILVALFLFLPTREQREICVDEVLHYRAEYGEVSEK